MPETVIPDMFNAPKPALVMVKDLLVGAPLFTIPKSVKSTLDGVLSPFAITIEFPLTEVKLGAL